MSELDEAAVAVATQASYDAWMATFGDPNTKLDDGDDEYQRSWRESTAAGITAYLAAAARPMPDAAAMEREVEAFKDALERFLMAWGNRFGEGGDAIAGERYNEVVALYRKAVSRGNPQ